jgi:prevent-host-death family protein
MKTVNTHEAKTYFSRLLRRVAAGEVITIANRGIPVARLVPIPNGETARQLGPYQGQMSVPEDFDAPLPADILDAFEGQGRLRGKKKA